MCRSILSVLLVMTTIHIFSCLRSPTAAREMNRTTPLDEACRQVNSHGKAVLCVSEEQTQALRPLAPIVYYSYYEQDKDPWDMHLYPSMFKIRYALPSDNLADLRRLPKCNNSVKDGYLILERAPNETTIQPNAPKVTKLADHVMPASYYTDPGTVKSQDPAFNYIAEGAQLFQKCVDEGLQDAEGHWELEGLGGVEFAFEWATLMASQPCVDLAKEYFHRICLQLEENPLDTNHRDRANLILRLVTVYWGRPSIMANLMMLFGCDTEESYDEFLSCIMNVDGMLLNVNVFQRNVDPTGKKWECETCSLHGVSTEQHCSP
jgi:hypothetical protein